jgi:hypothetical protein
MSPTMQNGGALQPAIDPSLFRAVGRNADVGAEIPKQLAQLGVVIRAQRCFQLRRTIGPETGGRWLKIA